MQCKILSVISTAISFKKVFEGKRWVIFYRKSLNLHAAMRKHRRLVFLFHCIFFLEAGRVIFGSPPYIFAAQKYTLFR